ncbi:hypothetical protein KJ866_03875 [Patescibacteria group bacterium]|nr:hypothetical protein [Patescibacteria group bacterium]MBU2265026.1 hypothetical protein [Patescibacteria group bacterium]
MENTSVPVKTTGPKDIFLELWVMGTLYLSASFLITLLFQYINYFFVDAANPYSFSQTTVRWVVAILVAILPTHIFALRLREKDYLVVPEKREHKFRKLLIYLTLFIAAIACVVDLATLVYFFLNGELSIKFLLKVLAVAIVAGGLFWYYLKDLKRESPELPQSARFVRWTALIFITAVIIGAFFISGSPFRARLEKLDDQRINDLQNIQSQIVYHWQKKGALPVSLNELTDSISGYSAPLDPETKLPYEYRTLNDLIFELCATWSAAGPTDQAKQYPSLIGPMNMENSSWYHKTAGRTCFERTIDPVLYAPDALIPVKPAPIR